MSADRETRKNRIRSKKNAKFQSFNEFRERGTPKKKNQWRGNKRPVIHPTDHLEFSDPQTD